MIRLEERYMKSGVDSVMRGKLQFVGDGIYLLSDGEGANKTRPRGGIGSSCTGGLWMVARLMDTPRREKKALQKREMI